MANRTNQCDDFEDIVSLLIGFLLGVIGGAAWALLFAPKSGKDLQDDLKHTVDEWVDDLPDNIDKGVQNAKQKLGVVQADLAKKVETHKLRQIADKRAQAKKREMATDSEFYEL